MIELILLNRTVFESERDTVYPAREPSTRPQRMQLPNTYDGIEIEAIRHRAAMKGNRAWNRVKILFLTAFICGFVVPSNSYYLNCYYCTTMMLNLSFCIALIAAFATNFRTGRYTAKRIESLRADRGARRGTHRRSPAAT